MSSELVYHVDDMVLIADIQEDAQGMEGWHGK